MDGEAQRQLARTDRAKASRAKDAILRFWLHEAARQREDAAVLLDRVDQRLAHAVRLERQAEARAKDPGGGEDADPVL